MSSAIGKLMVDMLIESASYIEDIMTFFNMFVKLNDFSTAKAFRVRGSHLGYIDPAQNFDKLIVAYFCFFRSLI